jgi:hypothetical protein
LRPSNGLVYTTNRSPEMQGWFGKELAELIASPNVQLEIYVTNSKTASKPISKKDPVLEVHVAEIPQSIAGSSIEVRARSSGRGSSPPRKQEFEVRISAVPTENANNIDLEKLGSETASSSTTDSNLPLTIGRPNLKESIRTILSRTGEIERTIVAACGPDGLMRTTRLVVGDLMVSSGRSVNLHCEKFGW